MRIKRKIAAVLVLCLVLSLLPVSTIEARAATEITDPLDVRGSDYSYAHATKLDSIFQGTVSLFSNTDKKYALGSTISGTYSVADRISGAECYIYAQAVYYYLFGDIPYHGEGIQNYWNHSSTVLTNVSQVSYEQFKNAGVGFGAYVRTTGNSDGSYNGQYGHSLIILTYDTESITYLDCNAKGDRMICVWISSWEEFNANLLSKKNRKISHVVQADGAELKEPTAAAALSIHKAELLIGEVFTLTLSAEADCDFYLSIMDADTGETVVAQNMSSTYTDAFEEAGHYVAWASADQSGDNIESNRVDFWVFGAPPTTASLAASKKELSEGETVTLSTTTDAEYVRIAIALFFYDDKNNGTEVCSGDVPYEFAYTPTKHGIYAGYVTAYTHEGGVDSNWLVFYVGSYTVEYDANGGAGAPSAQTKYYGKRITLHTTEPARAGYTFLGWAKSADATTPEYWPGDPFAENESVTLYAVWRHNCADGHEYVDGVCIDCGEAAPATAVAGDLDLDGDVDAEDLTLLARHVAGIARLTDAAALANADVDGNGIIDANDLTMHARFVAGIIDEWTSP